MAKRKRFDRRNRKTVLHRTEFLTHKNEKKNEKYQKINGLV